MEDPKELFEHIDAVIGPRPKDCKPITPDLVVEEDSQPAVLERWNMTPKIGRAAVSQSDKPQVTSDAQQFIKDVDEFLND